MLSNFGVVLCELRRFSEALARYDKAITVKSDYADAHFNRGVTLQELKRFEEALASYDRAINLRPDYAEALSNRGNTLKEMKRLDEALASYDRAISVRPDHAEALSNRGNALHNLKLFDEALASYDRAVSVRPGYAEALCNRGNTLKELKRFDEALASYDSSVRAQPDYAEAHFNEALCRLLIGDFDRGWEKHERRWGTKQLGNIKRSFSQPLWLGHENISGKTILLHAEQGYGDTIQFCRYVPLVAERGAHVILEVQKPLYELMSTLTGAAQVVSKGDPLPDFEMHCPLLSLPLAFGTRLETIPAKMPYLYASSQIVKNWAARLGSKRCPRIGLAWSGNSSHKSDSNRSIGLQSLLPLLDIDAAFVSLQKDVRSDDLSVLKEQKDILHFGEALKDVSHTAALISNLDLVISVDTSLAHLAGAIGKPVWVLLPFIPDWRWLLDREDSPWYSAARLFRQSERGDWGSVFGKLERELKLQLNGNSRE